MLDQDQEKLLDEATAVVKEQGFYMKRAIDNESLRDALKHASNMICELRTSLLSPKNYYELYMQVFQELQVLASFFGDKNRHNRKMCDLYESVQHAGNIVPRLYLVITVGAAYIKSMEAPARDILRDMTELCKGVQHPMRGLFLRYYLTQMCKDKLPDEGTEYERNGGGNLEDAFEFLLTNFSESSRLWIRLQHQGSMRDKQRRERERHDLRVLVGANLVRMAQLEGMSCEFYSNIALPKLIEQVVGCKDTMAQQYLLDCVIQVFSDECHLRTLDTLLGACMRAQPTVDLKPVLVNLMNRLANFVQANPENVPESVDIFGLFRRHMEDLLERPVGGGGGDMAAVNGGSSSSTGGGTTELSSLLELQVAFLSFTLTLYPNKVEYVDFILAATVRLLSRALLNGDFPPTGKTRKVVEGAGVGSVVDLLSMPLRSLSLSILEMEHFHHLMCFLGYITRKHVAVSMVEAVLEANTPLDEPEAVSRFLTFISPLVKDEADSPLEDDQDTEEFVYEQQQVGRLVHAIRHEDTDQMFNMYSAARTSFSQGGRRRIVYTLPPLIFAVLKLVPKICQREQAPDKTSPIVNVKKVFQFVHKSCTELSACDAEVGLRLFLQAAVVANTVDLRDEGAFEPICYEFLTQALVAYEEELSDSKSQFQGLTMIVGTITGCITCLNPDNYDNISAKITQHGAKLLKKPDQCRAILLCSHMFFNNPLHVDHKRVLECLKKCLKIADVAVQSSTSHVALFAEILDKYVYYFEQGNPEVTLEFIQNLISLCAEHIRYADADLEARQSFGRILDHIERKTKTDPGSKYKALQLDDVRIA